MKRVLLVSFGLMLAAAYVGCLPADMGGTTGTAGSNGTGTAGSTSQGSAGDNGQGNGGTQGSAGDTGTPGSAGDTGTPGSAGSQGGNGTPGSAGDTGTPGSAGSQGGNGTAGDSGTGRGGTTGTGNASGRGGTGGGTAGSGTGGRGGTGGGTAGSTAGTTGSAGKGGTTGSAGSTAGTTGSAGSGGTSGNAVCDSVKKLLDGFEYLLPCGVDQSYSVLVCQNNSPNCKTGANGEYMTMGTCNTDTVLTVDGPSTQSCTITLHVQGVVEPKHYSTGTGRCTLGTGATEGFASGPAAGGVTSGCYPNTSGNYNVYMMHVSDTATVSGSTGLTGTRYFWNAINKSEAHFSYKIDYTTPSITIKGGQKLWMLANDSNRSAIKNCADTSTDSATIPPGRCDPITVANVNPAPGAAITQPYKGQFVLLHVVTAQ